MYESYYGFTGKPFQLNPDPAFFFASKGHQRALAYLKYGVVQGQGFIVITGEVGAGKTTLARNLLGQLDPARVVAAQLVSTQLGSDELLQAVATAFGLATKYGDKSRLLAEIEAFFVALAISHRRPLLIVDEAQNLSLGAMEELRMLSNFEVSPLQSFLIGQPQLRRAMRSPDMEQLRQRVIATYHLQALAPVETQAYIVHRLKRVGWTGRPELTDRAFGLIHRYTKGIPREINSLCGRLMLAGYLAERTRFDAPEVQEVIGELREERGEAASTDEALDGCAPGRPQAEPPAEVEEPPRSPAPLSVHPGSGPRSPVLSAGDDKLVGDLRSAIGDLVNDLDRCVARIRSSLAKLDRQSPPERPRPVSVTPPKSLRAEGDKS